MIARAVASLFFAGTLLRVGYHLGRHPYSESKRSRLGYLIELFDALLWPLICVYYFIEWLVEPKPKKDR